MADYFPEEVNNSLEMAMSACQMAIKEQTNRWQNWNLLGVINLHKSMGFLFLFLFLHKSKI